MSRTHLLALMQEPMALEPRAFKAMTDALARDNSTSLELAAESPIRAARKPTASYGAGVAVIGVYGLLTSRPNVMEWLFPACCTSTQSISSQLRAALADEAIGCVILDFDTPGGSVYGVAELANEIFKARAAKPILGISNCLAASAGFWLSTQCTNFYCTPSGEVGSIGVLAVHQDWSESNKMMGVKPTYISAGPYKTEMNPDEPLGDDAKAYQQSRIDDYYGAFVKAVARGRSATVDDVRKNMGGGRVLGAAAAYAVNMTCGIKTFDQTIAEARNATKGPKPASAQAARNRQILARIEAEIAADNTPAEAQARIQALK